MQDGLGARRSRSRLGSCAVSRQGQGRIDPDLIGFALVFGFVFVLHTTRQRSKVHILRVSAAGLGEEEGRDTV